MTKIVAEIGINHGGNINIAIGMIHAAKESGADAVKFQFYIPEILCADRNNYDAYDILKRNAMHERWIPALKDECGRAGVDFICTPFCRYTADALKDYVDAFKIASPEVCRLDFVEYVASLGRPIILSNGRANDEILNHIFRSVNIGITLLYCVSKYPTPVAEIDLINMDILREKYKCKVGFSDHTKGIKTAIIAAERGADMVEKHFMVSKKCVDAVVSLMPHEFSKMATAIKNLKGV